MLAETTRADLADAVWLACNTQDAARLRNAGEWLAALAGDIRSQALAHASLPPIPSQPLSQDNQ